MMPGDPFDATGTLVRDGGGFALRRDGGGLIRLDLHRMPVDQVEKRVRLVGIVLADGVVEADGVAPA
ncbi:DUF5818 domain-containing protein [Sphingomonas montana]|uniref:DUF5818 domain-containing protein n=1 Tax=Sphingomonas montana TaxID=1843236 RepID=UPI00096F3766|nr:DUF5818 domain-containing protein [Sphingomonas montana]